MNHAGVSPPVNAQPFRGWAFFVGGLRGLSALGYLTSTLKQISLSVMNLSQETIRELRERLQEIESERLELRRKLESRLEDLDDEAEALEELLRRHTQPPEAAAATKGQPHRGEGRSVWVRQALVDLGRVASPTEVAEKMTGAGFKWDNGMNRNATVATDLHRMSQAKNGQVKRVKRGKYRYVDTGGAS